MCWTCPRSFQRRRYQHAHTGKPTDTYADTHTHIHTHTHTHTHTHRCVLRFYHTHRHTTGSERKHPEQSSTLLQTDPARAHTHTHTHTHTHHALRPIHLNHTQIAALPSASSQNISRPLLSVQKRLINKWCNGLMAPGGTLNSAASGAMRRLQPAPAGPHGAGRGTTGSRDRTLTSFQHGAAACPVDRRAWHVTPVPGPP